ncbi:MAG: M23 family metallopeptidase [Chloroflexota bacterium]|nr:M23 family metallopeptidase [Chloroflexota bacterium]
MADVSSPRLRGSDGVRCGDPTAGLGSSGASTGPHLHFEMWRGGRRVDPTRLLRS